MARLPQRVSTDLLRLHEAGYSYRTCLALDLDWLQYVQRFERMRDATKLVPAERRDKRAKPMTSAPKHTEEELLRYLGVDPDDDAARDAVEGALADIDWDAVPWDDDEPEGEEWND